MNSSHGHETNSLFFAVCLTVFGLFEKSVRQTDLFRPYTYAATMRFFGFISFFETLKSVYTSYKRVLEKSVRRTGFQKPNCYPATNRFLKIVSFLKTLKSVYTPYKRVLEKTVRRISTPQFLTAIGRGRVFKNPVFRLTKNEGITLEFLRRWKK